MVKGRKYNGVIHGALLPHADFGGPVQGGGALVLLDLPVGPGRLHKGHHGQGGQKIRMNIQFQQFL